MAHSLSAKKRVRQNIRQRALNRWHKSRFRSVIKAYNETIIHGSVDQAKTELSSLHKLLDQVAAKGSIHKKTASRYKGRLAAKLNQKKAQQSAA